VELDLKAAIVFTTYLDCLEENITVD